MESTNPAISTNVTAKKLSSATDKVSHVTTVKNGTFTAHDAKLVQNATPIAKEGCDCEFCAAGKPELCEANHDDIELVDEPSVREVSDEAWLAAPDDEAVVSTEVLTNANVGTNAFEPKLAAMTLLMGATTVAIASKKDGLANAVTILPTTVEPTPDTDTSSETDTEVTTPTPTTDTNSETEVNPTPVPDTNSDSEPNVDTDTETNPIPVTDTSSETDTEVTTPTPTTDTNSETEVNPTPVPDTDVDNEPTPTPNTETEVNPTPVPDTNSDSEPNVDTDTETNPIPVTDTSSETDTEVTTPTPTTDTNSETEVNPTPVPDTDVDNEPTPTPNTETEVNPTPVPDTNSDSEPNVDTDTETNPIPVTDTSSETDTEVTPTPTTDTNSETEVNPTPVPDTDVDNEPTPTPEVLLSPNGYTIHTHPVYGEYLDARDFGTDPTGETDSIAAINAALAEAHLAGVAVYLNGTLQISSQIVINEENGNVTTLFGDGMGESQIVFEWDQVGVHNPDTNLGDLRSEAGILIDGQDNKTIADLTVKYTGEFYREGESYFGKVNGILVNDASNTLISGVEATGANRAGVMFTSTETVSSGARGKLIRGEVSEDDVPVGSNNQIINSHLHHNRVAGALVAYQEDFLADGNLLAWNGHEADGGTGYGIAASSGSYNFGLTFTNNTTDHNYRKGLDVHDGDDIVISNNTLNGDRLYGISVYNRQFTMGKVAINDNVITLDPDFRLLDDDDGNPNQTYHGVAGIHLSTNTQNKDLHTVEEGQFEIRGNTILNLSVFENELQTYGIEFRNHEQNVNYVLNIDGNRIEGASSSYAIAVINDTYDVINDSRGPGSGQIYITDNSVSLEHIVNAMPVYIEEKRTDGSLRGEVVIEGNQIEVQRTDGWTEGITISSNATQQTIAGNTITLNGTLDRPVIRLTGQGEESSEVVLFDNDFFSNGNWGFGNGDWLSSSNVIVLSGENTYNLIPITTPVDTLSGLSELQAMQISDESITDEAGDEVVQVMDVETNQGLSDLSEHLTLEALMHSPDEAVFGDGVDYGIYEHIFTAVNLQAMTVNDVIL